MWTSVRSVYRHYYCQAHWVIKEVVFFFTKKWWNANERVTSVAKMDEVSLIVLTVLHTMFGEFPSKALTRRKSRYLFFETGSHQPKPAKLTQVLSSHYPWAVIGSYFVLRPEHSNWVCDTLIGQVPTKKRNLSFVVCALKSPWSPFIRHTSCCLK